MRRLTLLLLLLLSLVLSFSSTQASSLFEQGSARFSSWFSDSGSAADFLPPEEAFQPQVWVEGRQIFVRWDIQPGYYLYQERLTLSLPATSSLTLESMQFAPAVINEDEFFGVTSVYYDTALLAATLQGEVRTSASLALTLGYQGCAEKGLCYPPQSITVPVDLSVWKADAPLQSLDSRRTAQTTTAPPASDSSRLTEILDSGHFWLILGLFFVAGLGLTFTPCVLPMLPILSAIIIGKGGQPSQSASQPGTKMRGLLLSLAYVLGMAVTYALIGALMGLFGAGLNIQAALQSPWLLLPFALLFILLALAMFGVWDLRLPHWLDHRLQALQQPKGGTLLSVAAMGALSTLVVSPCMSAPLAGALVFIATTEDALTGAWALLAMGLGMGLPLILAGTFGAHWLPKAGAWMNQVKSFFGLLLLLVAIWLVERLLPAPLVLALWGLLALGVGVFIGGLHFQAQGRWAKVRLTLGLALILYAATLLLGALSGNTNPLQPLADSGSSPDQASSAATSAPLLSDLAELETLLSESKEPVLVDLYADWCISCKVMERQVFARADIQQALAGITRVKFDLTSIPPATQAWMTARQLFGPPSFLFYVEGEEWRDWRLQGEVDARAFLAHLDAFRQAQKPALADDFKMPTFPAGAAL